MRPIALDTNTSVGFKRGEAACVELIAQAPRLLISSTVLGELLAGFACGDREARNREELRRFLAVATVEVTSIGLETADTYGLLYRGLRQQGTPIPRCSVMSPSTCSSTTGASTRPANRTDSALGESQRTPLEC